MENIRKFLSNWKDEDDEGAQAEEYGRKLRELLTHDCERGKKEGCHELAGFVNAVERDSARAKEMYRQNCEERDYPPSCFALGYLHLTTKEKNYNEALKFFVRGCDGNSPGACNNAGLIYQSGHEKSRIEKDMDKAISLFTKACNNDHKIACFNLSCIYLSGRNGVAKDMEKALQLSTKACNLGHSWACANASRIYNIGDGVEKNLEKSKSYKKLAKELHDNLSHI